MGCIQYCVCLCSITFTARQSTPIPQVYLEWHLNRQHLGSPHVQSPCDSPYRQLCPEEALQLTVSELQTLGETWGPWFRPSQMSAFLVSTRSTRELLTTKKYPTLHGTAIYIFFLSRFLEMNSLVQSCMLQCFSRENPAESQPCRQSRTGST